MVNLNCSCDNCGKTIDDGSKVYCTKCYSDLTNTIDNLDRKIEKLNDIINNMEKTNET